MRAIRSHLGDDESIIIWFDLFSVNEHASATEVKKTFGWWSTTFKAAIKNIKNILVVLFPWKNPIPFTRSWCIFEIFCAISTGCKFQVTFTDDDRKMLKASGIDLIQSLVDSIDAEKSEATQDEDKRLVRRTIVKYSGGMDSFNERVREKVKGCYLSMRES
jgi:hypothetical protein